LLLVSYLIKLIKRYIIVSITRLSEHKPTAVPTYVFPVDIRTAVRQRFPDVKAGQHDAEYSVSNANVYTVTWNDFAAATWPKPPKACKVCNISAKKPY
jgi:hypothetical protein